MYLRGSNTTVTTCSALDDNDADTKTREACLILVRILDRSSRAAVLQRKILVALLWDTKNQLALCVV